MGTISTMIILYIATICTLHLKRTAGQDLSIHLCEVDETRYTVNYTVAIINKYTSKGRKAVVGISL